MLFFNTTVDGIQMGLCFAVLALGVYISYSILDFPDLSVDGTFPLGGVVCSIVMLRLGLHPIVSIAVAFAFGIIAGAATGFLHVKCKISKLLSGIITMTALLSINLALTKLLTKSGNTTTIFSFKSENLVGIFNGDFVNLFGKANKDYMIIAILLAIVIFIKILIDLFLKTKIGYMIKATGDNEQLVTSLGRDVGNYKILGLAIANGFSAMSGAIYSQLFISYDNNCGSGKVVLALASVIIGISIFANFRLLKGSSAVILGAIVYSLCLNYLVLVDTDGVYLKLLNAVLFALILIFNDKISHFLNKRKKIKQYEVNPETVSRKEG